MPQFPRREPEMAMLARLVTDGLAKAREDFPSPPVPASDLERKLAAYEAAKVAAADVEAQLRQLYVAKDRVLQELVSCVKADLRYAEIVVRDRPEKLTRLGWGPRRERTALKAPGEVRGIIVAEEGDTWVRLRWKAPVDGGVVAAYTIQRKDGAGPWQDAGVATKKEQLMTDQPRGVELSYRVTAMNRAGVGQPSATVTLVL